jgi:septum formation protein
MIDDSADSVKKVGRSERGKRAGVGDVILASASPRRRALLRLVGVSFEACEADIDEMPREGEAPVALATRLAGAKALEISRRSPESPVLGADTVVTLDGLVLGKPSDAGEARAMLDALRGRGHRVVTGLALARGGRLAWLGSVTTDVAMRAYDGAEVERYVASGRGMDKAGGYAIQDAEFRPVERIVGCYPNVVGLPLCALGRALRAVGVGPVAVGGPPPCALCERARLVEW